MSNLDFRERKNIEYYWRGKVGVRDIAGYLKRDHSVISRELNRNKDSRGRYDAKKAQILADRRARITNKHKLQKDLVLKAHVIKELKAGKSPEQIAGRLRKHPPASVRGHRVIGSRIQKLNKFKYKKRPLSWRRPTFALRLSSALTGLTAVFGMGTGVTQSLMSPRQWSFF